MKKHGFIKDTNGSYTLSRPVKTDDILAAAKAVLSRRFKRGTTITNPQDVSAFLISQIADLDYEVFYMIFLNNRHQILASEIMFNGTIDGASVYPRVCVKRALDLNAAAVILSHQHPSGSPLPSESDKIITQKIKASMALFDIRTLDHLIVGGTDVYSFTEHGLL